MTRDTEKCDDVTVVRYHGQGDKELVLLLVVVEIFCVPSESKLSDYSFRLQTEQQGAHSTAIPSHTSTNKMWRNSQRISSVLKQ